ncbi:MAG: hypothetical protein FWE53_00015 [Firmicutes bacterium]|nr:hypothetical protein [Bacillota bacterium]
MSFLKGILPVGLGLVLCLAAAAIISVFAQPPGVSVVLLGVIIFFLVSLLIMWYLAVIGIQRKPMDAELRKVMEAKRSLNAAGYMEDLRSGKNVNITDEDFKRAAKEQKENLKTAKKESSGKK